MSLNIYATLNFVTALIMGIYALVLYAGSSEKPLRAFSHYLMWLTTWALVHGIYISLDTTYPHLIVFPRYLYWVGVVIASAFFYFTAIYTKAFQSTKKLGRFLIGQNIFLAFIFFGTDAVVSDLKILSLPYEKFPVNGTYWNPLFNGFFGFYLFAGFFLLYRAMKKANVPSEKRNLKLLFWSSLIAFAPGVVLSVILPLQGQNFDYYWLSPALTLVWVIFITYAIFKNIVFSVRVLTTEVLILILATFLFLNIFLG